MSALTTNDPNRLEALYGSHLEDQVREAQLAAISAELSAVAPEPLPVRRVRRFRMAPAAIVLALFVILPITGAIASERTVPGDVLYPVKLSLEPIVSVFRPSVEAEHRVEEVELLIERDAADDEVATAITRAREAVAEEPLDAPLRVRLDDAVDRVRDDQPGATTDDGDREGSPPPSDDAVPGGAPTEERPPPADQPGKTADTTTTTVKGVEPPADRPTTTTTTRPERSDDPPEDPPPTDDGRGGRDR